MGWTNPSTVGEGDGNLEVLSSHLKILGGAFVIWIIIHIENICSNKNGGLH
jgi:hypothetical protein